MQETQQEAVPGAQYPESWDQHDQAQAESDKQLKLKAGDKVRLRIISGPLTYREMYAETGEINEQGKPKKKRYALPFGAQLPGYDFKVKYLVEVVLLDGPAKGKHRLYEFGAQVAKQLVKIKEDWGSTRTCDIIIEREGSSQTDTKYSARGVVASFLANAPVPTPQYNLEHEVRYSKKEDLDAMPKPVTGKQSDSLEQPITQKQIELINSLGRDKDIDSKWFMKTIERKFQKKSVQDLTVGQGSELIDTMKAL